MNLITHHLLKQKFFKKTLFFKFFLPFVFCFACISADAQDIDDLDELLIDRDIENYSIRVLSNYKVNKFSILNNDSRIRFVPNNRYGLGLGFANKKVIVDVAFNIKNKNKEETRRFDLQGTTILKNRHYVNIYAQTYRGFNAKNNFGEPSAFRGDVRSVSVGLNYLYTLDEIEFSYSLLKAGLSEDQDRDVFITGGLGVFYGFDYFSARPSILTENASLFFNEQGNIKRYGGLAMGVLAGFISYFKLPENITATLNVMPGIGLMNKKIFLQDGSYRPSNPLIYKLDFLVGVNYSFLQYYAGLTYGNGLYSTDFDNDNNYRLNLTNAKLVIGYKFKSRKTR